MPLPLSYTASDCVCPGGMGALCFLNTNITVLQVLIVAGQLYSCVLHKCKGLGIKSDLLSRQQQ